MRNKEKSVVFSNGLFLACLLAYLSTSIIPLPRSNFDISDSSRAPRHRKRFAILL